MASTAPRLSLLPDAAVVTAAGADARAFLHAQLTQDIADLPADRGTLAAWADPKGRVRALMHVVPAGDRWLLVTSADLAATVLAKLKLFVLRAQVTLAAADTLVVGAIVGDARGFQAAAKIALATTANAACEAHGVRWLRVGPELAYAIGTDAAIRAACIGLDRAPAASAELAAIRLGLPAIDAALTERYIPQMLNLDRLDAVAFDKGCYPGQEVIARTQNLGSVKRRMRRFAAPLAAVPARGTTVLAGSEPAGEIIRAAPAETGIEFLAVARVDIPAQRLTIDGFADAPLTEL